MMRTINLLFIDQGTLRLSGYSLYGEFFPFDLYEYLSNILHKCQLA